MNASTGEWENAPIGEVARKQEAEEEAAHAKAIAHFEHAAVSACLPAHVSHPIVENPSKHSSVQRTN